METRYRGNDEVKVNQLFCEDKKTNAAAAT
jgi:hypothetical protein